MNTMQRGIITLLKSAVTEQALALPLPEDFDLTAAEPLIKRHHMVTLVYDGAARCGIPTQHPVMGRLFLHYCKAVQTSDRQMKALKRLFEAFEEQGIDYMPLKGSRMKALYPAPELRVMADADILIRTEQYAAARPILEALNFTEKAETDHEIVWQSGQLYLELHKRLIPTYNRDFYDYFGDGWDLAAAGTGHRFAMSPEAEWIYLFTHFSKHYRDGGIGCRHVVDLWVYRRANPDLKEEHIRTELKKLGLLTFYENICSLLAVWFEDREGNDLTDFLTEFIFSSGSWGEMETRVLAQTLQRTRWSSLGFSGKLTYLWKNVFPPLEMLRSKYTVLQKRPWLLPLVWLIRPFYKMLFERQSLRRKKQDMDLISQEKLQMQKQLLQFVGLK